MPEKNTFPKVSIILPTSNRAKYILETVESVRNQTYQNWELLIIDDCSTDNTEELIRQINDQRIQWHPSANKQGIAGTRNKGLLKAGGELIAFIDSDDLWDSSKLEKQVAALNQYPEAGFSLTGGYNFSKLNEPLEYFQKQREGTRYDNIFIDLINSEVAATLQVLLMRKQCLQVAGSFKEMGPTAFILDLARHFKAVILFEPLFYRRLHDSNYSSINREKRYYDWIKTVKSFKSSLPAGIFRNTLFRSHINFGEKSLLYKKRGKAISSFFKAWVNKPFSIIPLKKTGKAILSFFKKDQRG